MLRTLVAISVALTAMAAAAATAPSTGSLEAKTPEFSQLVPAGSRIRVLADGFAWTEGPLWVARAGYLLFSDPPKNRMYLWAPGDRRARVFIEPSGGTQTRGFREAGSNGLKFGGVGKVLVADEGDRAIALLDLGTRSRRLLVERFEGRKLNSPNDIAVGRDGAIWFTDPPYGLEGVNDSPLKEQVANRVYRLAPDGSLTAEESLLLYPNGIAFSPNGRTLYVSNSDPKQAVILAWDVSADGRLTNRRVFADMTTLAAKGLPGLPDGMCIDERGDLWASGPGGVHVISPTGRELGLIATGEAISNCAFGGRDGRTLFMTSTHRIVALHADVAGARARSPIIPRLGR